MIKSTCPYCGTGCGLILTADGAGGVDVKGDPDHPANFGRLCSKGAALGETIGAQGRLVAPQIAGKPASWDAALSLVAQRFTDTIAEHGPDSVAFYVSGQLLTEDYYVANKLMKGFIGSANIDTNSRLCMASSVAGHRRAFGSDTVPGLYEDLEQADLVVLVGSNLAWCHPVLHQRLMAARAARADMRVVVIDPRRTVTCEGADLHLAIAPGMDGALFNTLFAAISDRGAVDPDLASHAAGLDAALASARATDPSLTGISAADLRKFHDLWIGTTKVVTVYSQGVNQSVRGTDTVNAILNCHIATGRIGRPGMGPFSVTGQPNAMGGREVGGLANMLACHLEIENPDHRGAVQGFWQAPRMAEKPGLKAVDMFRAVEEGRIKALWIICTNPAVSMPEAGRVARAIAACDFVVVSDMMAQTDTTELAHVLLPATGWGEKDGTVTNSERRISRQRPFRRPIGQSRADWDILADVGRRMGFAGFDYSHPAQIFAEHAALSGVAGAAGSDFDISDHAGISARDYDAMQPFLWPANARQNGGRFFGTGAFHHPGGKARLLPISITPDASAPGFRLNTGRNRDQWHSMTRTGLSPRLGAHLPEPYVEIHPEDAARLSLRPSDIASLTSPQGTAVLRVLISDRVCPGQVFAPIHWTGQTAPSARIDALVPSLTDPVSGQPDSKGAMVQIARFKALWYGFAVCAQDPSPRAEYWAKARIRGGYRMELAGTEEVTDWEAYARQLFGLPMAEMAQVVDRAKGMVRLAFHVENRLVAALFIGPQPVALSRDHVAARMDGLLPGHPLAGAAQAGMPDAGPTICACLNVGLNTIRTAIETGAALTVAALGEALGAGTSCGSCRPELSALLSRYAVKEAAE